MELNLVTNIDVCYQYMKDAPQTLVLYSHLPTAIVSLCFGFFVLFKNKKSLSSQLLFGITALFSLWLMLDLVLWRSADSRKLMASWSPIGLLSVTFFCLCLYFVYEFINKKDVPFYIKIVNALLLLPLIISTPTIYSLTNFDDVQCVPIENSIHSNYVYFAEFFILFWIFCLLIVGYRKSEKELKKQVLLLGSGIILFLTTFLSSGYISDYLYNKGYMWGYNVEQAGIFMMTVFLGFLTYMIVTYHAFKIKLLGAQALVVSLIILVGSQYFYATDTTSKVLTTVTLVLSLIFGYILIRSVKRDDERKEQLQVMADKLSQANDQLRKLDNAKTEFISIASHQLRTPITAIKGFASLLLEGSYGEVSESVHGALEKIFMSSERLVNLIEDLLNVSRIESGRMQFEFKPDKIERLVKELYDNFLLIAKNKKFYLEMKLPETELPEIVMDYTKIRELVSNFMDNALKYTEKGGVTIKAELRDAGVVIDDHGFVIPGEKSPYGKVVRLIVSDTGIGIPKEEIPYLFKKFSRGKDVARLHVSGTGLGLFVGKAIAEAHHGQVWVESDGAGMGSRFMIEIPTEHKEQ